MEPDDAPTWVRFLFSLCEGWCFMGDMRFLLP